MLMSGKSLFENVIRNAFLKLKSKKYYNNIQAVSYFKSDLFKTHCYIVDLNYENVLSKINKLLKEKENYVINTKKTHLTRRLRKIKKNFNLLDLANYFKENL